VLLVQREWVEKARIPSPMDIALNKGGDVPLHQQLAEQIVFSITTGRLRTGQQLPSVRSLARQLEIHHNTVSKAYQNLVGRGWLTHQRGSRIFVGARPKAKMGDATLDDLIDQTIRHAREKGYSLKALREKVLERLTSEPPEGVIIVEDEPELAKIISSEIHSAVGEQVDFCSVREFANYPGMAVGTQVIAMDYALQILPASSRARGRPYMPLILSSAEEQVAVIRNLKQPSVIGIASVSRRLLKTAEGLLAPIISDQHQLKTFLLVPPEHSDLRGVDVMFCDSLAMPLVRCRNKSHYRLIAQTCLEDLAAILKPSVSQNTGRRKNARANRRSGSTA
jgi:DNA-binding transcriptional regulator YhcF (GntR family)